jgi:hypothetical protein
LSFSNFNLFGIYDGGLRQITIGDADSDGNPNLYIAGHYNEAIFDWEFIGGNPLSAESYSERIVFMDDTTDSFTPNNDQGKVRVAKLFSGDIDNDGNGDIVFSSGSFASDKPQLFMIEHEEESLSTKVINHNILNDFKLAQNFPNPFNPTTKINYLLNRPSKIEVTIFNIKGKEIFKLYEGYQSIGKYSLLWNGVDSNQKAVPSGVYFLKMKTKNNSQIRKMILTK